MSPQEPPTPEALRRADDDALIALAQGEGPAAPAATEELLLRQVDRLYAICLSIVRDPEIAAELSQEAVLRLFRSLPRYRGDCAWSTWTYRVARNLCLNWRAKRREEPGAEPDALPEPSGTALDAAAARERAAGVRAAIEGSLDDEEREAVLLHYEAGLSMGEVTERMGLTNRSGARGVLQRARRKLKRAFADQMPEDSVVIRALAESPSGSPSASAPPAAPPEVRRRAEATLVELTRAPSRDRGPEPKLRTMSPRRSLID